MLKLYKLFAVSAVALALGACDVNKTEEGELPSVDADGGELPEYDVVKKMMAKCQISMSRAVTCLNTT